MVQRLFLIGGLLLGQIALAQSDSVANKKLEAFGKVTFRSMRTDNSDQLASFYQTVLHANAGLRFKATPWLHVSGAVYGLTHLGLEGISKVDESTGRGPVFEGNLWSRKWYNGHSHFALPELKAEILLGDHQFTIGRFLFQTPIIGPEPFPFPNANEGLMYVYQAPNKQLKLESAWITRISSRFNARFSNVGESIGRGGLGVGIDGENSKYAGNIDSDFLAVLGLSWQIRPGFGVQLWNQYTDNVMNNLLIEPKVSFANNWSASLMYIQQWRINNGGNDDPALTYLPNEIAAYFGLRLNKKQGRNLFQWNFSRVSDQGRLQLTRDWGLEPFYTFQRRNRVEGVRDFTALMFKWQQQWRNNHGQFRWFTSVSRSWMPKPFEAAKNKYEVPSNAQLDVAFKYAPLSFIKGLSAEVYVAYRFLMEDLAEDQYYIINRANFFHSDLIISYTF